MIFLPAGKFFFSMNCHTSLSSIFSNSNQKASFHFFLSERFIASVYVFGNFSNSIIMKAISACSSSKNSSGFGFHSSLMLRSSLCKPLTLVERLFPSSSFSSSSFIVITSISSSSFIVITSISSSSFCTDMTSTSSSSTVKGSVSSDDSFSSSFQFKSFVI